VDLTTQHEVFYFCMLFPPSESTDSIIQHDSSLKQITTPLLREFYSSK